MANQKTKSYTPETAQDIEADTTDKVVGGDQELRSSLSADYQQSVDAIRYFALDWDEYEDMLLVSSRTQANTDHRVSEGSLSAIVTERATRVVAQLPSGVVRAHSIQDQGKSLMMNLLLTEYVFPNANEQFPLKTKLWLWDLYSNVYGSMAMCYDWVVRDDYTGPDCWLVPPRNFFPQQGRLSIESSDFVFISTFVPVTDLQQLVDDKVKGYDLVAIQEILNELKGKNAMPAARNDYLRQNSTFELRRRAPFTNTGEVEIVTKYEKGKKGRWVSFAPDFDNRVIRNINNPHESGKIPVVVKYALPLLDSIIGLGDMERGRYMQEAMDTTINIQLDGQKLRTYPPIKIQKDTVVSSTIRYVPGARWLVTAPNNITEHQMGSPDDTLNQSYTFLKAALNNVTGTTTTQTSSESSAVAQGKTPTAINQQQASESTRDEQDRELFEVAVSELFDGFVNLINSEQAQPIELYMFADEVKQIVAEGYDDIKDMVQFEGKSKGKPVNEAKTLFIRIKPTRIKNERGYHYSVDAGSSMAQDQSEQHDQLNSILTTYMSNAETVEQLLATGGMTLDFAQLIKQWMITAGLKQWDNILKPVAVATPQGQIGASTQGNMAQGTPQGVQPAPSPNLPSVSLSGKLDGTATAGAEQLAGLPTDPVQQAPVAPVQPVQGAGSPQAPVQGAPVAATPQGGIQDPEIQRVHDEIMKAAARTGGQ